MTTVEKIPCKFCEGSYTPRGMKLHVTRKHPADTKTGLSTPTKTYEELSWWDKVKAKFNRL